MYCGSRGAGELEINQQKADITTEVVKKKKNRTYDAFDPLNEQVICV